MSVLDNFAFVLVRPLQAGNIGAAARALKNMGLRDLRVVAPRAMVRGRPSASMAVHADDVLRDARCCDSIAEALDGCTLAVGTTCRPGLYRSGAIDARDAAVQLVGEAAANRVAIIFGPEDTGLENRELKLCQRLITISTAPEYPSLNLAQAVMVVAYELMMAADAARDIPRAEPYVAATAVDAMMDRMSDALVAIGFLPAENPEHIMFALRAVLGRAGLRAREFDIFNGIARQIQWFAQGGFETAAAKYRQGRKLR
jgi:tRNA/rRNA methyltransferase